MPFPARYAGTCQRCFERINPGEQVAYDDGRELVHADCDEHYEATVRPVSICTTCHLQQPCDCQDGAA